ncbi:MAG: hypothetical protein J6J42_07525 [Lachnospiraceae bacterium]|nr:hypothetical protein [Lachnospiraceae bacterium]MBP3610167.1 hypothetical protein [Lachnospiraceae bacterium]
MKDKLVFMDVETDGLYGAFLTVAMLATDWEGNELERAYYGIKRENMQITEPWVLENVIPKLGDYAACESEQELLQKAWQFWLRYQEEAYAVCDVGFPVETRFLRACVALEEKEAMWKAPFPLIDLSSLLLAKGYDPLVPRKELVPELEQEKEHSALYDVEVSVKVWKKLMVQAERQTTETAGT